MAKSVSELEALAARVAGGKLRRLRNLIPGFKGSSMIIEWQGMQRTSFLLAATTREFRDGINAVHVRAIGTVSQRAEQIFRSSIERPQERGSRPGERMTGRFTFGARGGGTFRGVLIKEDRAGLYGFGYPNVRIADQKTRFVWRSLEFGLGLRGSDDPEGPRGPHKMPFPFYFRPTQGGVLFPRGPARAVFPGGKKPRGIEPKFFITRAMQEVASQLPRDYRQQLSETFGKL